MSYIISLQNPKNMSALTILTHQICHDRVQLSPSPVCQLNCNLQGQPAVLNISADRSIFTLLPPPARVYINGAATQKNDEKWWGFDDFSVLLPTFFLIKLLFLGWMHDLWYLSSPTDFCHAATAAWPRLLKQSGDTKEWQETIEFWWFYSSSTHLFFN
jgi:hypothetical protein